MIAITNKLAMLSLQAGDSVAKRAAGLKIAKN